MKTASIQSQIEAAIQKVTRRLENAKLRTEDLVDRLQGAQVTERVLREEHRRLVASLALIMGIEDIRTIQEAIAISSGTSLSPNHTKPAGGTSVSILDFKAAGIKPPNPIDIIMLDTISAPVLPLPDITDESFTPDAPDQETF